MKTQEEIINKLKELKPVLNEKFGIEEFAVFGSVAKNKFNENSDIDIAILKMKQKKFSLRWNAINYLQEIFNQKIDLGYYDSMKTFVKNKIKRNFIYV